MLNFKTKKAAEKELEDQIFGKRPLLKEIIEKNGSKSLAEFGHENIKSSPLPEENRKQEVLAVFKKILTARSGEKVASGVVEQLSKYYVASSAEHHGPLNSNKFFTANFLMATGFEKFQDPILKYIPVLSCSSVSLNNEDFPRGLLFHTIEAAELKTQRLSLLPSNSHNCAVYNFRSYKADEVLKVENVLKEKLRNGEISEVQAQKISPFLEIFKRKEILEAPDLCRQFTQVNFHLWKEIFGGNPNVPDLIYVELEELISQLLLDYHIGKDTLIDRMIFDPGYEEKMLKPLMGAMEDYVRQGYLSTYLFYGISEKNYRLKLVKNGDELMSEDGSFKINFTPEGVAEALRTKKIMPNLLTIYTILHLYYGFNCIGGFNQFHYLDAMQKVYNNLGVDGVRSEANSRLYGYGPEILFLEENGLSEPAYALDLKLYGPENLWEWVKENFAKLTLNDAFGSAAEVINKVLNDK